MDELGQDSEVVDPAGAAPLLEAMWGSEPDIRNAALPTLVRLPLSEQTWQHIRQYADDTLMHHAERSRADVLAVIEASPWITSPDTRRLAARVAVEALSSHEQPHPFVLGSLELLRRKVGDQPSRSRPERGFVVCSTADREQFRASVSGLTDEQLWSLLHAESRLNGAQTRAALVVTLLFQSAAERVDVVARYRIMEWIADQGQHFQPDLDGLVDEFLGHFRRCPDDREQLMAHQVAWVLARGGLTTLVEHLRPRLQSFDTPEQRSEAFQVVRHAAAFADQSSPPEDLSGGSAADVEGKPSDEPPSVIDDDVQFTLYRPSRVRPDLWYSMLAFAHRTEPTVDASGQLVHPIDEVEQRAERLLAASPGSFDVLRADSAGGLRRGTDLCFQPWIEVGEINPSQQSLRWEETVHQVEFRVRVPSSTDGRRLQGGMRVFAGAILLADVGFRLPVSSTTTIGVTPAERDTARRFRQIFASYSHRDVAVVDAVEQYVAVTGDRYLIDARTLRSGEVWDERLRRLIEEADIFQLFWSRNSMNSVFVKQEWEYALQLGREGFVRPVYWEDPLAEDPDRDLPPERLRRLHFSWLGTPPSSDTDSDAAADSNVSAQSPVANDLRPIVCRACGHANPTDTSFCVNCSAFLEWSGEKVRTGTVGAPTPQHPESTTTARPAGATADEPPVLAAPVPAATKYRRAAERRRSRLDPVAIAVAAVIVAVVVAVWWLVR